MKAKINMINRFVFMMVVLIFADLACSFSPQSSDSISVEDALATMTLLVWTPTVPTTPAPPTATLEMNTPIPIFSLTPSITSTRSFDWCLGMNTRLAQQSDINVGPASGDDGFAAYACLVEVVGPIDYVFAETALLVRIGFNDKFGVLHIYPALIKGLIPKAPGDDDFYYPACFSYSSEPEKLNLEEYLQQLQEYMGVNARPFPVFVNTIFGYKNHNPSEASLVNRHEETNLALQNAVKEGEGFPTEYSASFRLYIAPGLIRCP